MSDEEEFDEFEQEKAAPADRSVRGPLDSSEANSVRPYIDLGSIKFLPRDGLGLRLEVEEATQRVVAVNLDLADSSLQVQAFAAPRSTGLWNVIRGQLHDQIRQQGGEVDEIDGELGHELRARIPMVAAEGGQATMREAVFLGVDGPRWFLRGVITGTAASGGEAREAMDELFRGIVVTRGGEPMPPRDLLPLVMPQTDD